MQTSVDLHFTRFLLLNKKTIFLLFISGILSLPTAVDLYTFGEEGERILYEA